MTTHTTDQMRKMHTRHEAAKRVMQENRAQSICSQGMRVKIFPSDSVPSGWVEQDRLNQDSPDLAFWVHHAV